MLAIRRRYQLLRIFASPCPLSGTAIEGDTSLKTIVLETMPPKQDETKTQEEDGPEPDMLNQTGTT